jgi:hypothetical protein
MKLIKLIVALCFMLSATAAMAGGPNGPGDPVLNEFSGHAWYQGTGSGMVHERYFCDLNWENCIGHWKWYPAEKWPVGPSDCDTPLDEGELLDVGDGSHILKPGYYFVCAIDGEIFRQKP